MKWFIVVVFILLLAGTGVSIPYWTADQAVVTIHSLDHKKNVDGDIYLVYTEDEVYQNTDSLVRFKFNSSDIQNQLVKAMKNNREVRIYFYGFRIPVMSSYKNIYKVEEIQ